MALKILLLDCSKKLLTRLKRQGFDVEPGSLGYATGVKKLSRPIYEYNVFIYNPISFSDGIVTQFGLNAEDKSPEYNFYEITRCVNRGATILTFTNKITDNLRHLNEAYSWIPEIPSIDTSRDYKVSSGYIGHKWVKPIVLPNEVKAPTTTKLNLNFSNKVYYHEDIFLNNNQETLGVFYLLGDGQVIILPTYQSNEDIISIFLNRSIPKIYDNNPSDLTALFKSPDQIKLEEQTKINEEAIQTLESEREKLNEELTATIRIKEKTILEDETSKLLTNYYKLATDQEDSAIFYLYKIIDALKQKMGEKEAKNILKCNQEFNLIGTLANRTYADARHAPRPGEKIQELTTPEIEACFAAAIKIINSYFEYLFQPAPQTANQV